MQACPIRLVFTCHNSYDLESGLPCLSKSVTQEHMTEQLHGSLYVGLTTARLRSLVDSCPVWDLGLKLDSHAFMQLPDFKAFHGHVGLSTIVDSLINKLLLKMMLLAHLQHIGGRVEVPNGHSRGCYPCNCTPLLQCQGPMCLAPFSGVSRVYFQHSWQQAET